MPVRLRLPRLIGRQLPERQLAQRRQIPLAEEVRERLLDLGGVVDISLAQSRAQRLDRDVHVDDLVGALQEPVGHRLADAHAGRRRDRVVQRLDVLDVDRGDHVDLGVEQRQHVLVALLVCRAWGVGVRQLVDDGNGRVPGQDRVQIHLAQRHAAVLDLAQRHLLETVHLGQCVRAAVRLDEPDHDVHALTLQLVGILEHLVALADARRRPDVHTKPGAPVFFGARQQRFGGGQRRVGHARIYFFIGYCASSARFSSSTLTRGSPRKPSVRPSVCASTSRRTSASAMPRSRATRGT